MSSIPPPPSSSSSSSKFLCYYGCRLREDRQDYTLVWYALELPDGEKNGYPHRLPQFNMVPCDATCATVSVDSKIYCLLGVSRRLLCLDTNQLNMGWTEIPTRMKKSRILPVTAMVDGKFYVMGGGTGLDPWAEVFDPSIESWGSISSPLPESPGFSGYSYFVTVLALDDDGYATTGVSRKLILLTSTRHPSFYVYDVLDKRWTDPPPQLTSNFFNYSFYHTLLSQPVVVGKTVYWYTDSRLLYAYDLELQRCFEADLKHYFNYSLPPSDNYNVVFFHLGGGGERFCLLSAIGPYLHLLKFSFSKGDCNSLPPPKLEYHFALNIPLNAPVKADISVEGEWCLKDPQDTPTILLGGMTFDGKLPGYLLHGELGKIVNNLHPSKEDEYIRPQNPIVPHAKKSKVKKTTELRKGEVEDLESSLTKNELQFLQLKQELAEAMARNSDLYKELQSVRGQLAAAEQSSSYKLEEVP